jgi:hypothetical protein
MSIRYSCGAVFVLFVAICSVLFPQHATLDYAQAGDPMPLDCLADATDLALYRWGHYHDPIALQDWQWDELRAIPGDNKWVGYDNGGWDIPGDLEGQWKIVGEQYGATIEIWLWTNNSDYYYLFPLANNEPYMIDGDHWGVHPCGGFEVDKLPVLNVIAKIQDNVDYWGNE